MKTTAARGVHAAVEQPRRPGAVVVEVADVRHAFGTNEALRGVSLSVAAGEIHALLGPNGAGKTTLLRVLCGLVDPRGGSARVAGLDSSANSLELRSLIGLVPSGDRSFYLRISGLENLVFFGRLHGLSKKEAVERARRRLAEVGLEDVARQPVYAYSHGMQKRLSVARALLCDPSVLLVDEATHDLDPEGSQRVRELVRAAADSGAAVIWTTQRLDEIRGFAARVTLLANGQVRFSGTVPELMSLADSRSYLLGLDAGEAGEVALAELRRALGSLGELEPTGGDGGVHARLRLSDDAVLGDALLALGAAGARIVSIREERSEIEEAFFVVTAPDRKP